MQEIHMEEVTYTTPVGRQLFCKLNFDFEAKKIGLIGRNGIGKSTLLKLIAGELLPETGKINISSSLIAYVPQITVPMQQAEMEQKKQRIIDKIHSNINGNWLKKLLSSLKILSDDYIALSGGEQKLLLILEAFVMDSDFLLLDEPECSLDYENRILVKNLMQRSKKGILLVSHDRNILNEVEYIVEIREQGLRSFRGNFEHYKQISLSENSLLEQKIKTQILEIKELEEQKEKILNRQHFLMQQAADDFIDKRYGDFWCDTPKKDRAAKTLKKLKQKQEEKKREGEEILQNYIESATLVNKYNIPLPSIDIKSDETVLELTNVFFGYRENEDLIKDFSMCIMQGEKVAIVGKNGIGKTTLLNIMQGKLFGKGFVKRAWIHSVCVDQFNSLVNLELNVIENIMAYNSITNKEKIEGYVIEVGFPLQIAQRKCRSLSGGECMITGLLMVLFGEPAPDIIFLDEPTNHLDIQCLVMLENIINNYFGTVVLISHDEDFLNNILFLKKVFL